MSAMVSDTTTNARSFKYALCKGNGAYTWFRQAHEKLKTLKAQNEQIILLFYQYSLGRKVHAYDSFDHKMYL